MTNHKPYTTETREEMRPGSSRTVYKIDLPRFARDLADALGGKLLRTAKDDITNPDNEQKIDIGPDRLTLSAKGYSTRGGKVIFSICAPEVPFGDRPYTNDKSRTESATISPDGRGILTIANDIRKRVIDASQAALSYQREHARERSRARTHIACHMADLGKRCPTLDIKRQTETDETATIWNRGGAYISARLNANGTVSIDRIETTTFDKFARIVDILNEKAED